jgi:predicted nucleic acid-binding protein
VGLIADLGDGPVGIDSVVFIYLIEEHRRYLPLVEELFTAVDAGRLPAVTSSLTLLEVLVMPYRAGDLSLAERYEALLTRSRGLRLVELDRAVLRIAAQLCAVYPGLRTPDALQLAAARAAGCTALLTNDRRIPSLPGLRVVELVGYLR